MVEWSYLFDGGGLIRAYMDQNQYPDITSMTVEGFYITGCSRVKAFFRTICMDNSSTWQHTTYPEDTPWVRLQVQRQLLHFG
jgi:hypothetical protein